MQKYLNEAQDTAGNALKGARITVRNQLDNTLAMIYSDNGVNLQANPIVTGRDGEYGFYAPNGRYRLDITAPRYIGETVSDILLYDPAEAYSPIDGTIANTAASAFASAAAAADAELGAIAAAADSLASAANSASSALAASNAAANAAGSSTVNSRQEWAPATAYAVKDVVFIVTMVGIVPTVTWYICLTAHTSSPAFATDSAKWRVYQGVVAGDLFWVSVKGIGKTLPVVAQLSGLVGINANSFTVLSGYRSPGDGGGGVFYWDAAASKSLHNGGTVIDPNRVFPLSLTQEAGLLGWYSYAPNAGVGCFVRVDGAMKVASFGGIPNNTEASLSNYYAIKTTVNAAIDYRYKKNVNVSTDYAELWNNSEVIFGAGIFHISRKNALRPEISSLPVSYNRYRRGLKFSGAGQEQTILFNDGMSGSDFCFWENYSDPIGGDSRKLNGFDIINFSGLSFHGPDADSSLRTYAATNPRASGSKVNAFGIFSTGWDKEFAFHEVGFAGLDNLMNIVGTSNGDKNVFYRCLISPIRESVLACANDQSVANSFIECNFFLFGDLFKIGDGGGGGARVEGGSCVAMPVFDDTGLPSAVQPQKAMVNMGIVSDSPTSRGSYYYFSGVTFEFYGEHSKDVIISSQTSTGAARVIFDKCDWSTVMNWGAGGIVSPTGSYRAVSVIGNISASISYTNCLLSKYRTFYFENTRASGLYAQTPMLILSDCECNWYATSTTTIETIVSNKVEVTGGARVQITGCSTIPSNQNYNSMLSASSDLRRAIGIFGVNLNSYITETDIKPIGAPWGNGTATVNKLLLPKRSEVVGVSMYRKATSSPNTYSARFTNGKLGVDKVIYAEWTQPENTELSVSKNLIVASHDGLVGVEITAGNLEGLTGFATVKYK